MLQFQLEEAVEKEDFEEAAKLKLVIAETARKDSVTEIMHQLKVIARFTLHSKIVNFMVTS